jgi:hypothetical protein
MNGDRTAVADRLTELVKLPDVHIGANDFWMPLGLPVRKLDGNWDTGVTEEAKLGESKGFLSEEQREEVTSWWLAVRKRANTPNWDIASTCTIGKKKGLLLVEAKAHVAELTDASDGSSKNHEQIGLAIGAASSGLNNALPGWSLSCDSHYQLANRFAWAWKLASIGIPVVLVYLGFVVATEVNDLGATFVDGDDWSRIVLQHSRNIVPEQAWGRDITVGDCRITPLTRVWREDLPT